MQAHASLLPLGLAAALLAAPLSAQAVAKPVREQEAFVLRVEGLTTAQAAKVQTRLAAVPTVTAVAVDAATGAIRLNTAAGEQLDSGAARAAAEEFGLKIAAFDVPDWAAETVWVVKVKGGA